MNDLVVKLFGYNIMLLMVKFVRTAVFVTEHKNEKLIAKILSHDHSLSMHISLGGYLLFIHISV